MDRPDSQSATALGVYTLPPGSLKVTHPCPRCGSDRTRGHGSFLQKDGTRQRRRLCHNCGRTFSPHTGTPLHYLKKRLQWAHMAARMVLRFSIRRMAAAVGVQPSTAFRWRHRLLSSLCRRPQPVLTGLAAASEAYVPYSEKGSRKSHGPGAHGSRLGCLRRTAGPLAFRRFTDGRPSCVLLACTEERQVLVIAGRGQVLPEALQSCLARVLGAGAELWALGLAPYAEACRRSGIPYRDMSPQGAAGRLQSPCRDVDRLRWHLYAWLRQFRGVATRYLQHYLAWFQWVSRSARPQPKPA